MNQPPPIVNAGRTARVVAVAAAVSGLIGAGVAIFAVMDESPGLAPAVRVAATIIPVLVSIGVPLLIVVLLVVPLLRTSALLKTGEAGTATVLKVRNTGAQYNGSPQVRFLLEVHAPGRAPYQTEAVALVSRHARAQYQPGTVVAVRIDPANPARVAVAEVVSAATAPDARTPTPGPVARLEPRLQEILDFNHRLNSRGETGKARILKAEPLGGRTAGQALQFELEVHPIGGEVFLSRAAGIIDAKALDRFQPGREIWVRIDPADKSRVAIYHS